MMFGGGGWWSFIRADAAEKPKKLSWDLIKRVMGYSRPYLGKIIFLFITIIISTALSMVVPLILRELIDHTIPQKNVARLNALAVILFLTPLLNSGVLVVQRWLNAAIGEGVIYDLRCALYNHFQQMAVRF